MNKEQTFRSRMKDMWQDIERKWPKHEQTNSIFIHQHASKPDPSGLEGFFFYGQRSGIYETYTAALLAPFWFEDGCVYARNEDSKPS